MKEEKKIICEVLKNSITMIDYFYEIISDGYNPAKLDFKFNLDSQISEEEIFIYDSPNWIGTEEFFKSSILPTKRKVENPVKYLTELIDWNKKHIESFNSFPDIFLTKYRNAEFNEMLQMISNQTNQLVEDWNTESFEYIIDTKDGSYRKFLLINDKSKSILFEFGNYIH
ncbi:hypothetical protein SAMN05444344_2980 [Tenacibaculum mesophilum]|uniref:Uncharacterized protein n=2 Tax=Tenacibaculum mesophilum TaxID=104268 RepID=A0ABM7CEP3_9FLAO|nr:hypothetical protein D6200_06430 [Tenacibaculum mesophilum]SHG17332.1 hypothetical protein SAMN05444344_2980 [Tenacibaculum mesophilum]